MSTPENRATINSDFSNRDDAESKLARIEAIAEFGGRKANTEIIEHTDEDGKKHFNITCDTNHS